MAIRDFLWKQFLPQSGRAVFGRSMSTGQTAKSVILTIGLAGLTFVADQDCAIPKNGELEVTQ